MKGFSYTSVHEAAKGLLGDVVRILNENEKKYIIMGGWSPFFLNNPNEIHPGTKDVDILFEDGETINALRDIIGQFIKNGYLLSAKHDFQLLKVLKVNEVEMVFNVDLLHPSETKQNPDLFVEHLDLEIPVYKGRHQLVRSMVLPETNVLFKNEFFTEYNLLSQDSEGMENEQSFKLMDEAGCILTKAKSVHLVKRPRDSFDIFLAINNARDYKMLLNKFELLEGFNPDILSCLYEIKKFKNNGTDRMVKNIKSYADIHVKDIDSTFGRFFKDLSL
ncbi:hypothetical protein JDS80_13400 [Bacillus cereus group sp. N8]|uniref:hypothetical protein n=1 Tax=Bacillus cereus group sp. N8 TaxID=2794584 RepID=UPI0018F6E6DD|nr:hypothetical protein [Bacillus cereus group sp. N8]MBJ8104822.1 hypothetical protein [Bacillus cereus group sp. N8]